MKYEYDDEFVTSGVDEIEIEKIEIMYSLK